MLEEETHGVAGSDVNRRVANRDLRSNESVALRNVQRIIQRQRDARFRECVRRGLERQETEMSDASYEQEIADADERDEYERRERLTAEFLAAGGSESNLDIYLRAGGDINRV